MNRGTVALSADMMNTYTVSKPCGWEKFTMSILPKDLHLAAFKKKERKKEKIWGGESLGQVSVCYFSDLFYIIETSIYF